jgi:hypothetical protein
MERMTIRDVGRRDGDREEMELGDLVHDMVRADPQEFID